MSLNSLLIDSGSKGWADLYIDTLKVYNGASFLGPISQEGDLTVKGKLILDGSNNSSDNAIEILDDKNIEGVNELRVRDIYFTSGGLNIPLDKYEKGSEILQTGGSFIINPQIVQIDFIRIGDIISASMAPFSISNTDQNPSGTLELIPGGSLGFFQPTQTFEIPLIVRSNVSGAVDSSVVRMGSIQWNGSAFVLIPEVGTSPNWYQDNDNQSGIEARFQFQYHD